MVRRKKRSSHHLENPRSPASNSPGQKQMLAHRVVVQNLGRRQRCRKRGQGFETGFWLLKEEQRLLLPQPVATQLLSDVPSLLRHSLQSALSPTHSRSLTPRGSQIHPVHVSPLQVAPFCSANPSHPLCFPLSPSLPFSLPVCFSVCLRLYLTLSIWIRSKIRQQRREEPGNVVHSRTDRVSSTQQATARNCCSDAVAIGLWRRRRRRRRRSCEAGAPKYYIHTSDWGMYVRTYVLMYVYMYVYS